jgi:hypothetical protein
MNIAVTRRYDEAGVIGFQKSGTEGGRRATS